MSQSLKASRRLRHYSSKNYPDQQVERRISTLLRQARKADASAIHALLWACRADIPLTDKFINDWYREWLEQYCKRRSVWVVANDGEIAGAMVMMAHEIFYLVVALNHRRAGVAQSLIAQAKRYALNKRWNTLKAKANPTNAAVQNLLIKEEFHHDRAESDLQWNVFYWRR
jgi:GNAT superfamily N-acetyltransferase